MKKFLSAIIFAFALVIMIPSFVPVKENIAISEAAPKVKINKKKATLIKGQTLQLKISGTSSKVRWSTSKKSVATVTKKGKVRAKKKGNATITAKVNDKKHKCRVTVETPKINKREIKIDINGEYPLTLKGTKQNVKWKSSNKAVASVSKAGVITGKKKGTATITATVKKKEYKCKVNVSGIDKYEVSNYFNETIGVAAKKMGLRDFHNNPLSYWDLGTTPNIMINVSEYHKNTKNAWTLDILGGSYMLYGVKTGMNINDACKLIVQNGVPLYTHWHDDYTNGGTYYFRNNGAEIRLWYESGKCTRILYFPSLYNQ